MNPTTFAQRYCFTLALPFAGERSARLAAIAYRMGIRAGRRKQRGRSIDCILRRLPSVNAAYLAALSAERDADLL